MVKKTRGILNKLTPENFEKLVQKFLQLNLEDNDDRIGAVINVVFEKAIDEPSFSTAYARMVCPYSSSCQSRIPVTNVWWNVLIVLASTIFRFTPSANDLQRLQRNSERRSLTSVRRSFNKGVMKRRK